MAIGVVYDIIKDIIGFFNGKSKNIRCIEMLIYECEQNAEKLTSSIEITKDRAYDFKGVNIGHLVKYDDKLTSDIIKKEDYKIYDDLKQYLLKHGNKDDRSLGLYTKGDLEKVLNEVKEFKNFLKKYI